MLYIQYKAECEISVKSSSPTISRVFFHFRTFPFCLSFSRPGGSVDVPGALEVDVFLHSDEVGRKLPHVLAVVYNADHRVAAGEEVPAEWEGAWVEHTSSVAEQDDQLRLRRLNKKNYT